MNHISSHINSFFNSLSYRVGPFLLDPGDEWEGFENVEAVLLTHAHFDHIYGLNRVAELNPSVKVYTNKVGQEMLLDARKNLSIYNETPFVFNYSEKLHVVEDDDIIHSSDGLIATAIFTPGHNPSCITWIIDNNLFTGDSYIPGLPVVTNLPKGNRKLAEISKDIIFNISKSSIESRILPGHPSQ